MKITKPFCIDDDIIKELKKVNASELVNLLLKEHFDDKNSMNLTKLKQKLNEKQQEKKQILRDIRDIRRKIDEISKKEARILRFSQKYPEYVFKTIEGCENINKFFSIYRTDKILKQFKWLELKQLFSQVKGGA